MRQDFRFDFLGIIGESNVNDFTCSSLFFFIQLMGDFLLKFYDDDDAVGWYLLFRNCNRKHKTI